MSKVKLLSLIIWKFVIERGIMNDHGAKDQKHFPHASVPSCHLFLTFSQLSWHEILQKCFLVSTAVSQE